MICIMCSFSFPLNSSPKTFIAAPLFYSVCPSIFFFPPELFILLNYVIPCIICCLIGQSSESLQQHGLDLFQQLLRDSISNRAACVRAGMLNFLLDWFPQEKSDSVIFKIAHLIQVIGGHSISGKDIRKIFALLRSEKVGSQQKYCSLLLSTVLSMLNEKGPTAFFDFSGNDSVSLYAFFTIPT